MQDKKDVSMNLATYKNQTSKLATNLSFTYDEAHL